VGDAGARARSVVMGLLDGISRDGWGGSDGVRSVVDIVGRIASTGSARGTRVEIFSGPWIEGMSELAAGGAASAGALSKSPTLDDDDE
jgi:hypothetical protein